MASAEAGAWKLSHDHIKMLMARYPQSQDLLLVLGLGDFGHMQLSHVDKRCMQLALMLLSARQQNEDLHWGQKLEWDVKIQNLTNKITYYCPKSMDTPNGATYGLLLQASLSGALLAYKISVSMLAR